MNRHRNWPRHNEQLGATKLSTACLGCVQFVKLFCNCKETAQSQNEV